MSSTAAGGSTKYSAPRLSWPRWDCQHRCSRPASKYSRGRPGPRPRTRRRPPRPPMSRRPSSGSGRHRPA